MSKKKHKKSKKRKAFLAGLRSGSRYNFDCIACEDIKKGLGGVYYGRGKRDRSYSFS